MADIYIEHAHSYDFDYARTQAQKWLAKAKDNLGLDIDYVQGTQEDYASIKKAGVDARAVLTAQKVIFQADLTFFAKPLKGVIVSGIQQGLEEFFK